TFEAASFEMSDPLRQLTRPYINAGLRQKWNMFSNPETDDHYLRLDYHLASTERGGRIGAARELVFPLRHEGRLRILHDFRDKAVANAVENYHLLRAWKDTGSNMAREFSSLARFFRKVYQERYATASERVVRVDIWYGAAPMPHRGQQLDPSKHEA